jgi:YVTN family beta-propeller protein
LLINQGNKDYKIQNIFSYNTHPTIILSTFAILLLYLSSTFLFGAVKHVWADSVVSTIPVGAGPLGVAITPDNFEEYTANVISNTVSAVNTSIDTSTNTISSTVPVGSAPLGVAIAPDGSLG